MSYQNPGVESPKSHPDEALQPTSPDFREMPHVPPLSDTREPVPMWLYIVCGIILFLTGSSFNGFGMFGRNMLDQGPSGAPIASASTQPEAPLSPIEIGKKIYGSANCANCHQATGMGQPGSYPPLAGSEYVLGSKERLIAILLKGLQGPVTVKGSVYSTAVMPAQETILTPEKLANLATYIRGTWGNTASAVTVADVTAAKTKYASHSTAWTEADLKAMPATDPPAAK